MPKRWMQTEGQTKIENKRIENEDREQEGEIQMRMEIDRMTSWTKKEDTEIGEREGGGKGELEERELERGSDNQERKINKEDLYPGE